MIWLGSLIFYGQVEYAGSVMTVYLKLSPGLSLLCPPSPLHDIAKRTECHKDVAVPMFMFLL
jgi:hypothetical protein